MALLLIELRAGSKVGEAVGATVKKYLKKKKKIFVLKLTLRPVTGRGALFFSDNEVENGEGGPKGTPPFIKQIRKLHRRHTGCILCVCVCVATR